MRRVRLIIATDPIDGPSGETAYNVIEDGPEFTGLLDANGNPIPKRRDRVPIGFYVKAGK